jgi:hypothetical protein
MERLWPNSFLLKAADVRVVFGHRDDGDHSADKPPTKKPSRPFNRPRRVKGVLERV